MRLGGKGFERFGDPSVDRGRSRLGREEDVGVEMRGIRRPLTEVSRGLAIVDILGVAERKGYWYICGSIGAVQAGARGLRQICRLCSTFELPHVICKW